MCKVQPLDILAAHLINSAGNRPNIFIATDNDSMTMIHNAMYAHSKPEHPTFNEIVDTKYVFAKHRAWFKRETQKYPLHPMIDDLLHKSANWGMLNHVKDWREMLLEWPHGSTEDENRIAYTQSHDKGLRNIQTVTTLGKYLRRHMPTCPDHTMRDFVLRYTIDRTKCFITTDMDKIIDVVQRGPRSCMQDGSWDSEDHPYIVYEPRYGWALAYRLQGDEYYGRALVNKENMTWVRSYKRCPNGGYSHDDPILDTWLQEQGYTHADDWDGLKLAKHGDIMPYLDGDSRGIDDHGDYWMICCQGEYSADQTNGRYDEGLESCADCGDSYHEDHMTYIEDHGDVCDHCLSHNYTYVIGRRGDQYYVDDHRAVYCESDGEDYDRDYLDDNDIVYVADERAYYHQDATWYCEGSGDLYHIDTPSYEVDGCYYHEDYLPDGWEVEDGVLRVVEIECE